MTPSCRPADRHRRRLRQIGGRRVAGGRLRQAEVEDLHDAVRRDLDVRRLQIAVHDALLVRGFERLRDLSRDGQRFVQRYGSARDAVGQRLAVDQLEHQGPNTIRVFQSVDRADVRMIE